MILSDFHKYAISEHKVSSLKIDFYQKQIESSMTPMILEERELRATLISVFDRLLRDRILWVAGPVNDYMATVVQAQLMYLTSVDKSDVTMYINTPGGGVYSGLAMVDVMDYVDSDIATVNVGMAASMGSVLLGAGTKGKRSALRFSKVMLHQSSGGFEGNIQDAEVSMNEWAKLNNQLFDLLGSYCGKSGKTVKKDSTRDLWLNAQAALEYGIIDEIVTKKIK